MKEYKNKYGLQELERFSQTYTSTSIDFAANKLKSSETKIRSGSAFRIVKDKKIGFVSAFGNCNYEELIQKAVSISKYYPELNIVLPSGINLKELNGTESKEDFFQKSKSVGEEIINYIHSKAKSDSLLVDLSFTKSDSTESIENTNDLFFTLGEQIYSFSINIRETLESDFVEIFSAIKDIKFPEYKAYVDEMILYYLNSKKTAKVKSGCFPVLFTCNAAKDLFDIVEVALNGKHFAQKSTPWHDKISQKVLSEKITLKQIPLFGNFPRSVDDEGVKASDLTLIENGILKNFYFDLVTAEKCGNNTKSNGCGFRGGVSSKPEPSLLNLIISSGEKSLNDIVKNINYGLLVVQTMGGLTTNISGDMSVNIDLGYLIENGEIVGRVKDTMLTGNIYTALGNVIEISNNPRWYYSNSYNSDFLLDGFSITAKN